MFNVSLVITKHTFFFYFDIFPTHNT